MRLNEQEKILIKIFVIMDLTLKTMYENWKDITNGLRWGKQIYAFNYGVYSCF